MSRAWRRHSELVIALLVGSVALAVSFGAGLAVALGGSTGVGQTTSSPVFGVGTPVAPLSTTATGGFTHDTVIDELGLGHENQVYEDFHGVWQNQSGTFVCQVDAQPEQSCNTPVGPEFPTWYTIKYNGLAPGDHTFKVTAIEAGVRDPTPATRVLNIPTTQSYTLTTGVTGSGTITGSGINCPGTCSASFSSGTSVTLTESPSAGNTFSGWGGACSGTSTTCTVTMSSAKSVTASFATNNSTNPPFLQGLTKAWGDDASRSNPVESGRWDLYSCQRKDGQQSSSTSVNDLQPGRFSQFSSGGPGNKPYYHFYAPQGDNIWTPGSAGRCELSYPVGDPGNAPPHTGPPGAYFFYEGRRAVTMFSVRLPSGWDVNAPSWRVIAQWKQNEWVDTGGVSPALALEQRSGNWIMTSFGGPIIWSMPASAGSWVNFAFDITYSGNASNGRVKVYADTNNDGTYEYSSSTWTGRTLFQQNGTGVESVYINGLYEGVGGDSIDKADMSIWN